MTLKRAYDHETSAAATLDIIDLGTVSKEPLLRRWLLPIGQDQTPVTRMTRHDHGKTVEAFRSTESISQLPETRLPTQGSASVPGGRSLLLHGEVSAGNNQTGRG